MSSVPHSERPASPRPASPHLTKSSTEELDHGTNGVECGFCERLRLSNPEYMEMYWTSLIKSAEKGCELCDLLRKVIKTAASAIDEDGVREGWRVHITPQRRAVLENAPRLSIPQVGTGRNLPYTYTHFYLTSGHESPWPFLAFSESLGDNPKINYCARFITSVLYSCNLEHKSCATHELYFNSLSPNTATFVPKRLLYIGNQKTVLQTRPYHSPHRTAVPNGQTIQYVALTYCWGSTPMIKTTTITLLEYTKDGIEWTDLPKTFQEAIMLTRKLGVYYIWIDSLCIVQDSVADWAQQSAQMADIFYNAYLTIAASAAENGQEGLLNRHKLSRINLEHNSKAYSLCFRNIKRHEMRERDSVPFPEETELTLRKRAWCFQEELLSRRVVHFTKDEIVFVCREATMCECTTRWLPRFKLPPIIGASHRTPNAIWGSVVEHYTRRQISFCRDRLPALSSLTRFFERTRDNYLAGLWESHMPICLLWWTEHGSRSESPEGSESNPPSWSWASIEGMVHDPAAKPQALCDIEEVARVLNVRVYPSTDDPRGMVFGGHITLRAPLLSLDGMWTKYKERKDMPHCIFGQAFPTLPTTESLHISCGPGWDREDQWTEEDICSCLLDDTVNLSSSLLEDGSNIPLFFLVIRTAYPWRNYRSANGRLELQGLLLKPFEALEEVHREPAQALEHKLMFVRVGMGVMELCKKDAEKALKRFGDTILTVV